MSPSRLAPVGLAAAMLLAATPALAGNGSATRVPPNQQEIEQLGPKNLLGKSLVGAASSQTKIRTLSTLTTRTIPVTIQTLKVEELGPKNLLGR